MPRDAVCTECGVSRPRPTWTQAGRRKFPPHGAAPRVALWPPTWPAADLFSSSVISPFREYQVVELQCGGERLCVPALEMRPRSFVPAASCVSVLAPSSRWSWPSCGCSWGSAARWLVAVGGRVRGCPAPSCSFLQLRGAPGSYPTGSPVLGLCSCHLRVPSPGRAPAVLPAPITIQANKLSLNWKEAGGGEGTGGRQMGVSQM